jgi:hypothetical protein
MESMNPGPANLKPSLCGECQLEPPACACTVEGQVAISQVRSETHRARVEALARTGEPLTEIGRSYNVRFRSHF